MYFNDHRLWTGNVMAWLRWHLEGNVLAIVVSLLVAAALISVAIFGTPLRNGHLDSFGPDWECSTHEWGDPICIKKMKP